MPDDLVEGDRHWRGIDNPLIPDRVFPGGIRVLPDQHRLSFIGPELPDLAKSVISGVFPAARGEVAATLRDRRGPGACPRSKRIPAHRVHPGP